MENRQTTTQKETDNGEATSHPTQQLENADQANQTVSPDGRVIAVGMKQSRESMIQNLMESVIEIDDRVFKICERIQKPIPEAQSLSTDAGDLRDRLVEAKKLIVRTLKDIMEAESIIEDGDFTLIIKFKTCLSSSLAICQEADSFLYK